MKESNVLTQCPSDEELMQYKLRRTSGHLFERLTEHLTICDSCVQMLLDVLPESEQEWVEWKNEESDISAAFKQPHSFGKLLVDDHFLDEFEEVRTETLRVESKFVPIDDVPEGERFKAGQIWLPRATDIVIPGESGNQHINCEHVGASNHFIVLVSNGIEQVGDYQSVRALVLDDEYEDPVEELVIPREANPLETSLVMQPWNQVEVLVDNLSGYYGEIDTKWIEQEKRDRFPLSAETDFFTLLTSQSNNECYEPSYLVAVGLMADARFRYRAREYAATEYLRIPIDALRELLLQEHAVSSSESSSVPFMERLAESLKTLLTNAGLIPTNDDFQIRAISGNAAMHAALAADRSTRIHASLKNYRGGWVALEIENNGQAKLRAEFDFPSALRVSLLHVPTNDWIQFCDRDGQVLMAPLINSRSATQYLEVKLPSESDLESNLRLVVFDA